MPFLTDATWPAGLQTIFDTSRQGPPRLPFENRYFGPYTKLLTYCFSPDSFDFFIAPEPPPPEFCPQDAHEFVLYLVIYDARRRPVLAMDIKGDGWVKGAYSRRRADKQMRQRFDTFAVGCPLPRLWGLSVLGTSLRVYVCNIATGEIEPPFMKGTGPDPYYVDKDFLEDGWDIDILSQEGFTKMKEITQDIISNATTLERA